MVNRAAFYYLLLFAMLSCSGTTFRHALAQENTVAAEPTWISALDEARVTRIGQWQEARFRYAAASHLATNSAGAALECRFRGSGIVVRLGSHAVPAYGVASRANADYHSIPVVAQRE